MRARVIAFPPPRTPVFRRSGPMRWLAALILLLVSAAMVASLVSAGSGADRRTSRNPASPGPSGGRR